MHVNLKFPSRTCPHGDKCAGLSMDAKVCIGECQLADENCEEKTNEESLSYCLNRVPQCASDENVRKNCDKTCCYSKRSLFKHFLIISEKDLI